MQTRLILAAMTGIAAVAMVAFGVFFFNSSDGLKQAMHAAPIGGPFTLVDDNGRTVTEKILAGKPSAIYFGYTYCPDVCPTTLLDLSRWIQKLGPDADKLNYVFVTIDPERDTPS